jgi:hypothetical protein
VNPAERWKNVPNGPTAAQVDARTEPPPRVVPSTRGEVALPAVVLIPERWRLAATARCRTNKSPCVLITTDAVALRNRRSVRGSGRPRISSGYSSSVRAVTHSHQIVAVRGLCDSLRSTRQSDGREVGCGSADP